MKSAAMKIAIALALTASVDGCARTQTSVSAGPYVDDAAITAKVETAISQDPALKAMQIEVETNKDTVQLSGFVDKPEMIVRAGEIARQVSGVAAVQNNLMVKQRPMLHQRNDGPNWAWNRSFSSANRSVSNEPTCSSESWSRLANRRSACRWSLRLPHRRGQRRRRVGGLGRQLIEHLLTAWSTLKP